MSIPSNPSRRQLPAALVLVVGLLTLPSAFGPGDSFAAPRHRAELPRREASSSRRRPAIRATPALPEDIYWSTNFAQPGFDYEIESMAVYNSELIVGGALGSFDGQPLHSIARWDGTAWQSLGAGVNSTGYGVTAMMPFGTDLLVAGDFDSAGGAPAPGIARWDGTNWHAMGSGPAYATSFVTCAGALYANGGDGVYRWNGSAWTLVLTSYVDRLGVWNNKLIAVGFLTIGTVTGAAVAAYDGNTWTVLANDTDWHPTAAVSFNGDLYVSGWFSEIDGVPAEGVARWDGTAWHSIGLQGMPFAEDLVVYGGRLYVIGYLRRGQENGVLAWDGTNWTPLAGGTLGSNSWPKRGIEWQGSLVIGGTLSSAGTAACWGLALWNGAAWSTLGTRQLDGVDGLIWRFLPWNGRLVAAGQIGAAGNVVPPGGVALFDGTQWSAFPDAPAMASGALPTVYSLASLGPDLLIGGTFDRYRGAPLAHVARWDGAQWQSFGAGLNSNVWSLTTYEGQPIAGGDFTASGATGLSRVARWDGAQWQPMGAGFNGTIFALLVHAGQLFAAGAFTASGPTALRHIAVWDGAAWGPVGTGINGSVYSLASYAGQLVAAGYLTEAGGVAASRVARWDGNAWAPLGSGVYGDWDYEGVYARDLLPFGGSLYVTGHFRQAGGVLSRCVARWDGATWHRLGTGVTGGSSLGPTAYALGALGDHVYVSGDFDQVAYKSSLGIARWEEPVPSAAPETPPPGQAQLAAWPNPSHGPVTFRAALRQADTVTLEIVDVQGRRVRQVMTTLLPAGDHRLEWDGMDDAGRSVVPGVYLARLMTAAGIAPARVVRLH